MTLTNIITQLRKDKLWKGALGPQLLNQVPHLYAYGVGCACLGSVVRVCHLSVYCRHGDTLIGAFMATRAFYTGVVVLNRSPLPTKSSSKIQILSLWEWAALAWAVSLAFATWAHSAVIAKEQHGSTSFLGLSRADNPMEGATDRSSEILFVQLLESTCTFR